MKLVLQDHLHTRQRGIATTLTQAIDGDMQSLGTTQHSGQRIRDCKVVIIMRMEIEMGVRVALDHLTEKLDTLERIHDAQGVGQHEASDTTVAELIHQLIDV